MGKNAQVKNSEVDVQTFWKHYPNIIKSMPAMWKIMNSLMMVRFNDNKTILTEFHILLAV